MPVRLDEYIQQDAPDQPKAMRLGDFMSLERVKAPEGVSQFNKGGFIQISDKQRKQWEAMGPIGYFEQAQRQDKTEMIPFNPESAVKGIKLLNAVNRLKADRYEGKEGQKAQDLNLTNNYLFRLEEERIRGFTIGGKITKGVAELPGFMVEFLATGGAAALGKTAVRKAVGGAAQKIVKNKALQFTTRVAGATAGAFVRTAAMPHRVTEGFAERQIDAALEWTENGLKIAEQSTEKPFVSAMKAYGDVVIENFSEVTGPALTQVGAKLVPRRMANALTKLFQKLHPEKRIAQLFTKSGYNGFLEELGEERVGAFLRAITGVEDFGADGNVFDRVIASIPDGEELLVEAGVLAFPGAANAGVQATVSRIKKRKGKTISEKEAPEITNEQIEAILSQSKEPTQSRLPGNIVRDASGKPIEVNPPKEITPLPVKIIDNVRLADVQAESKIAKAVEILEHSPQLEAENLYDSKTIEFEKAKNIAQDFYFNELFGTRVSSPAFNGEKILFDEVGWGHISKPQREGRSDLTPDDIKRRLKLLPKVREIIEKADVVENIDPEGIDGKTFALLGKFKDGSVVRVVVQQIEKGGKRFFSVFDLQDVSKKISQASLPGLTQGVKSRGGGKAPSLQSDLSTSAVNSGETAKTNINISQGQGAVNPKQLAEVQRFAQENRERILTEYAQENGNIVSTDRMKEFFRPLGYTGLDARPYQAAAGELVQEYLKRLVKNQGPGGEVLLMSGGPGAGKSSAVGNLAQETGIVFDLNLTNFEQNSRLIEQILAAGQKTKITYVLRDPDQAFVKGVLKRALDPESPDFQRVVPIDLHVHSHQQAKKVFPQLIERFGEKVDFEIFDNRGVVDQPQKISLDQLKAITYNYQQIQKDLEDAIQKDPNIPTELKKAFLQKSLRSFSERTNGKPPVPGTSLDERNGRPNQPQTGSRQDATKESVTPSSAARQPKTLSQKLTEIEKNFVRPQTKLKKEIKAVQEEIIKELQSSNLEAKDKAKFIATIKNIQTIPQLERTLPEIRDRISGLEQKAEVRQLKRQILKTLKTTSPKKQSGKPVGKFTPEIQNILDRARIASQLTKTQAEELIQKNIESTGNEIPSFEVALENRILSLVAGLENKNPQQLRQTLNELETLVSTGRAASLLKKLNQKERNAQLLRDSLDSILGDKPPSKSRIEGAKERFSKKLRSLGNSLVGWNDILDILSQDDRLSKAENSKLSQIARVSDQETNEKQGIRIAIEKFMNIAQESFSTTNEKQLFRQFQLDEQVKNLGQFIDARGQEVNLQLSKSEARKRWMELEDPSLEETFKSPKGNAYTDEMIQAMNNFLTEEDIEFAQKQMDFYREFYQNVNNVYRELYGVDLPFNENYSPISRDISQESPADEFLKEINFRRSVASGSLKSRVANIRPIKEQSDIQVIQRHITEMEHFKAWAFKIRDLNLIFSNGQVKKVIEAKFGREILGVINGFIQDFTRGGINRANNFAVLEKLRVNFTRSALAIKPALTLKQMVSFLAFAEKIPTSAFVKGTLDFLKSPVKATEILNQSELLKTRSKDLTRDIKDAVNSQRFALLKKNPGFLNSLMLTTRIGDKGAILLGGWSVYKFHRDQGKSHQEAILEFERATAATQQSGDLSQLSRWQRGGSFAKLFTMFTSSQNQYFRRELGAVRNAIQGRLPKDQLLKRIAIYHFFLPMLFQWVVDFGRWNGKNQLRAAITGSLNGIFILNDMLEGIVRVAAGERPFPAETPIGTLADGVMDAIREIGQGDLSEAIKDLAEGTVGPLTGTPFKTLLNSYEGALDVAKGDVGVGALKLMGWSPFVIESNLKDVKNGIFSKNSKKGLFDNKDSKSGLFSKRRLRSGLFDRK